jgi:hypothetical protein
MFSYLEPLAKVYERLRDYANMCDPERNLQIDHIQLYRYDDQNEIKIPYNTNRIQLSDLVDNNDHTLSFEELAYPLKDLVNKEVVKI